MKGQLEMHRALALALIWITPLSALAQSPLSPDWGKRAAQPSQKNETQTEWITAPPELKAALNTQWIVSQSKSKIDDSTNVTLTIRSTDRISGRFMRRGYAEIIIRCHEGVTAITFSFADHFLSSIQQYGRLITRIDKRPARTVSMRESTDHSALGLWNGGSSIPFIKTLFGADTLFVRVTPFTESPRDAEFKIAGLQAAITPLRKACRW